MLSERIPDNELRAKILELSIPQLIEWAVGEADSEVLRTRDHKQASKFRTELLGRIEDEMSSGAESIGPTFLAYELTTILFDKDLGKRFQLKGESLKVHQEEVLERMKMGGVSISEEQLAAASAIEWENTPTIDLDALRGMEFDANGEPHITESGLANMLGVPDTEIKAVIEEGLSKGDLRAGKAPVINEQGDVEGVNVIYAPDEISDAA